MGNLVRFIAVRSQEATSAHSSDCAHQIPLSGVRHIMIAAMTIAVGVYVYQQEVPEPVTTTITTTAPPMCATEHSNVKAIVGTVATVSVEAMAFSILAKLPCLMLSLCKTPPMVASTATQASAYGGYHRVLRQDERDSAH